MSSLEFITLTIDRLSFNGGRGVGRYQNIVVFVPDTAPGDLVKAKVVVKKSNLWEAELVEVLNRSPHRREPPCPVAGTCGGCAWQHVTYAEQLVQKQGIIAHALKSIQIGEIRSILPAPSELRYRNRVQLHLQHGQMGFFAKRSRTIVPIEDCLIAELGVVEKFKALRAKALTEPQRLEVSVDGELMFSQVNSQQNRNLIAQVLAAIENSPSSIADLYAGYGNLTGPLSEKFPQAKVTAVELSQTAVERGQNALSQVSWFAEDVGKFLKNHVTESFELVVVDPPRPGCDSAVIDALCAHNCSQLVYVSCNPMTFARDAKKLVEKGGFRVNWVQPLDMFPQTEHIELVAKFSRL